MEFTQHLIAYYKGERLEAILLAIFGFALGGISCWIWQHMNQNQMLKGLFYPVAFLAVFTSLASSYNAFNNNQRIDRLPPQYLANKAEFIGKEWQRFEGGNGVNKWWTPLKITWAVLVMAGLVASFTTRSEFVYGIAVGLMLVGAMGFLIDGFAHQRAKVYTAVLMLERNERT